MPHGATDAELLSLMEGLALEAGRAIMAVCEAGFAVEAKDDHSPVTKADRAAEAVILEGLRAAFPDTPVVAEEEASEGLTPAMVGAEFFLVDPLDGTKEFVRQGKDFTVNIALVRDGVPDVGVVLAPAAGQLYSGLPGKAETARVEAATGIAERRPIRVRNPGAPPRIVASRSHRTPETDAFIARYPGAAIVSVGSSLKFCMLAAGEADLYPRFGPTMQWDTAAGDAVLRAAGGVTTTTDGAPLQYGPDASATAKRYGNPYFIARGG